MLNVMQTQIVVLMVFLMEGSVLKMMFIKII